MHGNGKSEWRRRILLAAASTLVVLLAFELGLRALWPQSELESPDRIRFKPGALARHILVRDQEVRTPTGQVFRIVPEAVQAFRNGGTNPASYAASTVVLGGTFTASVDNALAGQTQSLLFAFDSSTSILLGAGQTLLALDTGDGELFTGAGLPPSGAIGSTDTYTLLIPDSTALCGLSVFTQAIQFGNPPFDLSNANDLDVGY